MEKRVKRKILPKSFFEEKTLTVAKDLIGCFLVRKIDGKDLRFMITETEAYIGPHDLACHSSKGRTPRCEVMFGSAGIIYIYFIYGMHFMLNIVTEKVDYPSAVLIRGISGISGPGRITKKLEINKNLNGKSLGKKTGLWIEEKNIAFKGKIIRTPRIGVDYSGPIWKEKKYRFLLK